MAVTAIATAALGISLALTWLLSRARFPFQVMDQPGVRSLHDRPLPRTGGLAILAALAITLPFAFVVTGSALEIPIIAVGGALVAGISFWDDLRGLSAGIRLFVHGAAACLLLVNGFGLNSVLVPALGAVPLGWFGIPISLLFVIWLTNLFNFMDGMDGFAGGMGLVGFSFLAVAAGQAGHESMALLSSTIAAAYLGFLVFNFPPARIFLGDVGAVPMGFMAAAFSLWGARDGVFPIWVPMLIFSPFIIDATVTVVRRTLNREKVWRPHRSHIYQRVVLLGWGHRNTVIVEYALMLGTGATAIVLNSPDRQGVALAGLLAWMLVYAGIALGIGAIEKEREAASR